MIGFGVDLPHNRGDGARSDDLAPRAEPVVPPQPRDGLVTRGESHRADSAERPDGRSAGGRGDPSPADPAGEADARGQPLAGDDLVGGELGILLQAGGTGARDERTDVGRRGAPARNVELERDGEDEGRDQGGRAPSEMTDLRVG